MASRLPFLRTASRTGPDGADRPVDVFVRGLLSGALVGAVIAGSAIWERRHRRRAAAAAGTAAAEADAAATHAGPSPGDEETTGEPGPG